MDINLGHAGVTAQNSGGATPSLPPFVEQGFRWIRETVALIYAHHRHPLPVVALIFMYAETLGKPLAGQEARPATKCGWPNHWIERPAAHPRR